MTQLELLLQKASPEKRQQLLNAINCLIVIFNRCQGPRYRWQGGLTVDELAALVLIYQEKI